jgi:hypothetical protein
MKRGRKARNASNKDKEKNTGRETSKHISINGKSDYDLPESEQIKKG